MLKKAFRFGAGSQLAMGVLAALFVATPALAQPKAPVKPKPPPVEASPPPPVDPAAAAEATAKEEARKHFDQGLALFDRGSLETAFPEFERSIAIYPTRAAIKNAALCLRRLNRFAEAVEMNERLLATPNVSAEEKAIAEGELTQLRPVVGNIIIDGIQSGATITIDGKPVGTTPLKGPLHVSVGTRTVRILKAGFETFEKRIEAPGGKEVTVRAVLAPLELSGWLSVEEASGYNVDVVLDGVVVGKTPWRGLISTGEHLVVLRGDKRKGTQPARIEVRQSQVTNMLVIAEELGSDLRVESQVKGGEIYLDGVFLGRDAWEGQVRTGSHRVEIGAAGYVKVEKRIEVGPGKRELIAFAPGDPVPQTFWDENPAFIELGGAFAIGPTFGGDLGNDCGTSCASSVVMGGMGTVRGGIWARNRWTIGFDLGFLHAQQTITDRTESITPVGLGSAEGMVTDALTMTGVTAGVGVGVKFGERFPISFRLGVGGFFGSFSDHRYTKDKDSGFMTQPPSTAFSSPGVPIMPAPYGVDVKQSSSLTAFYAAPEVRVGVRARKNLDVMLSLGGTLLIFRDAVTWRADDTVVDAKSDGLAKFEDEVDLVGGESITIKEKLMGSAIFVATPGILVNYRF